MFRKLEQAYSRQKKLCAESSLLGGIGSFIKEVGGPAKAIGDVFVLGHHDATDPKNKRLRHDWAKLFLEAGKLYDAKNAETTDLDSMDADDMKAVVTKVAIEFLAGNAEFRDACLTEALERNPNLLEEFSNG